MKANLFKVAIILALFGGCAKEPIFKIPPPISLKSWLEYKDTNWNGLINLNSKPVNVKSVSNYVVLLNGADTSISIRFYLANSYVEQVAIKFRRSLSKNGTEYTTSCIENVYIETNNAIYYNNDIKIDTIYFKLSESQVNNTYVVNDFYFAAKTNSVSQPNTNFTLNASSLQVLKSFFDFYEKGKKIATDQELLNVDLKGGNEFSPAPLIDYKLDLNNPNDFLFINIPTESLMNAPDYDARKSIRYRKRGKFYPAKSGTISVNQFYYKSSILMTGKNWVINDTTTNTNIITIDSVRFQQFSMPF